MTEVERLWMENRANPDVRRLNEVLRTSDAHTPISKTAALFATNPLAKPTSDDKEKRL